MTDDAARAVLARWGIGPEVRIARATSGMMNETFIVTTAERRLVLRLHRRTERSQIEFEHAVITHARQRGVPTPAVIDPAGEDHSPVAHEGAFYSLFAFARGEQLPRPQLTPRHARSMGECLGRLHHALADFPVTPPAAVGPSSVAETAGAVDDLIREIESRPAQERTDHWALQHLRGKRAWLGRGVEPVRQPAPPEGCQLVHGDFQESNLFFADGQVVEVIDWDKAEARWPVDEIIRTLDLSLRLRPELTIALLEGYRTVHDLSQEDLEVAAANYGHDQVHSQWLFDMIYRRGDDRLRVFLEPGPFVTFADRWAGLRPALAHGWR